MARNAEKAMTTLARWRAAQLAEQGKGQQERRPYLASECGDLPQAEKWRMQIVREIAKKVAQIQNAGLGEFRIRDLNDEINKLLREKGHWEYRIKELGGRDYARYGPKMLDHEGKEVPGNRGYKYFGAAKELPGVWELFEQEPPPPPRKSRAELMREIDADYYGYRDDDDGLLVPLEMAAEKAAIAFSVDKWKAKKEATLLSASDTAPATIATTTTTNTNAPDTDTTITNLNTSKLDETVEEEDIYPVNRENEDSDSDSEGRMEEAEEDGDGGDRSGSKVHLHQFIAHVPVPSQKEVEEALLERKKRELLDKYVSESMQEESQQIAELLNHL